MLSASPWWGWSQCPSENEFQKAACGRKKSPAVAGKKTAACGGSIPDCMLSLPKPTPMGWSYIHTP